jgi:hypothetical protein
MPRKAHDGISDATIAGLRRESVACQLDDVNAMAESWATALDEKDIERAAAVRAAMERHARALAWNVEGAIPALLAYAEDRRHFGDELFAPAFVLQAIAPDHPETAKLLARISDDCRVLLERALAR